jgi:hypothetical protein
MPILNYTTTIAAIKTVGEIQALLTTAGATRILIENNAKREPAALVFELHQRHYRLPCRHEAIYKKLSRDRNVPSRYRTPEQALRTAWRILKNWVEAQVAILETEMVQMDEVFMPYQVLSSGQTFYEEYKVKQLEMKP